MFKVTVRQAAKARGVKTYYQLARLLDSGDTRQVKHLMMARRLWEGKKHVPTLPTLGLVCDALDCELSDLIVRNGKRKRTSA